MPTLPPEFAAIMIIFQPLFSKPVFGYACVLIVGAILAPGRRTVTSGLRIRRLSQLPTFQNYHRVLNRAQWAPGQGAHLLL